MDETKQKAETAITEVTVIKSDLKKYYLHTKDLQFPAKM